MESQVASGTLATPKASQAKVKKEPGLKKEPAIKKEKGIKTEPEALEYIPSNGMPLSSIEGIYDITCPTISDEWPDLSSDTQLRLCADNANSCLWGTVHSLGP
jgi:hypothetical protein